MITYTARDHDDQLLTMPCPSREAALDLVESDLLNGVTPVLLEISGVRLSLPYIMALVTRRRLQGQTTARSSRDHMRPAF